MVTLGGYILGTKSVGYEKALLSPMLCSLQENKDVVCFVSWVAWAETVCWSLSHWPAEERARLCRGHTISLGTPSVPACRNHIAGRQSPAQPGYQATKAKPQVQGAVCQMKTLGSGWGLCPEAVLKHFGPLHVLMRKQASHFFIALGPAMKSNLLQEVKIPPGFHKDIYGMR